MLTDDGVRRIDKATWDALEVGPDHRLGMVCTQAASFADLKKALLKLCDDSKLCTVQDVQAIESFSKRVDEIGATAREVQSR